MGLLPTPKTAMKIEKPGFGPLRAPWSLCPLGPRRSLWAHLDPVVPLGPFGPRGSIGPIKAPSVPLRQFGPAHLGPLGPFGSIVGPGPDPFGTFWAQ